jgi:ABC-type transport system substrate-binding protein
MRRRLSARLLIAALLILLLFACGTPPAPTSVPGATPSGGASMSSPTPAPAATPTDTPTLPPTVTPFTIRVEADGSGDYPTLQDALNNAPEGAMILLGAGTHRVEELIMVGGEPYVSRSVHLVGAGVDDTEIVGHAVAHVLRFEGDPMPD